MRNSPQLLLRRYLASLALHFIFVCVVHSFGCIAVRESEEVEIQRHATYCFYYNSMWAHSICSDSPSFVETRMMGLFVWWKWQTVFCIQRKYFSSKCFFQLFSVYRARMARFKHFRYFGIQITTRILEETIFYRFSFCRQNFDAHLVLLHQQTSDFSNEWSAFESYWNHFQLAQLIDTHPTDECYKDRKT